MQSEFFALLGRLKYINRWGLMRNARTENVAEHTFSTAVIANALCVIANELYGEKLNPDKAASLAVYHESAEALTGDLPTPVKYYGQEMLNAYKNIEAIAEKNIIDTLPENLKAAFSSYVTPDKAAPEYLRVKQADKIAAYIKCLEERASGNTDFVSAEDSILKTLKSYNDNAVNYFIENFISAFTSSLDENLKK